MLLVLLLLNILLSSCHARETPLTGALQLLRPNDERNRTSLLVVESTMRYIEQLEGPVAVVSIVGPYHTGKSFLLNQVVRSISMAGGGGGGECVTAVVGDERKKEDERAAPSEPGVEVFQVGRDVNPETSGVWMYHRSLMLPPSPFLPSSSASEEEQSPPAAAAEAEAALAPRRVDVLFVDTEGFSVSNVTESYDAKVFAASTLLSSLLLYNSMHVLHANELEYLDLLVHNTQLFSIKTALKQEEEERKGQGGGGGRFPFLPALFRGGAGEDSTASLSELLKLPPLLMRGRIGGREGGNG